MADAVLVTGSAGFIGKRLVANLREIGCPVVGLDRAAQPAADALRIDLRELMPDDLPRPCPPTIVHLAHSPKNPAIHGATTTPTMLRLLGACAGPLTKRGWTTSSLPAR